MFNEPQPDPISDGPVETAPRGVLDTKVQGADLLADLKAAGIELGAYDRRIIDWLAGWDYPTVATIASLIRCASHRPG